MTEKRFTISIDSNDRKSLWDDERTEEEPLIALNRFGEIWGIDDCCKLLNELNDENEQLKQSNERIVKDIDLALGFIRHKGYSLQDIKDYEDAKKEYEEDLAYYRKGDVE